MGTALLSAVFGPASLQIVPERSHQFIFELIACLIHILQKHLRVEWVLVVLMQREYPQQVWFSLASRPVEFIIHRPL